tara:strand:+ start:2328 stop:2531 length:204 start_codon:yes stop_codon:yes gene_type:complete
MKTLIAPRMFKDIPEGSEEEKEFRLWARENYEPLSPILGIWHPVVQNECVKMNETEPFAVDLKEVKK